MIYENFLNKSIPLNLKNIRKCKTKKKIKKLMQNKNKNAQNIGRKS